LEAVVDFYCGVTGADGALAVAPGGQLGKLIAENRAHGAYELVVGANDS
jgi:hypothetical protein